MVPLEKGENEGQTATNSPLAILESPCPLREDVALFGQNPDSQKFLPSPLFSRTVEETLCG